MPNVFSAPSAKLQPQERYTRSGGSASSCCNHSGNWQTDNLILPKCSHLKQECWGAHCSEPTVTTLYTLLLSDSVSKDTWLHPWLGHFLVDLMLARHQLLSTGRHISASIKPVVNCWLEGQVQKPSQRLPGTVAAYVGWSSSSRFCDAVPCLVCVCAGGRIRPRLQRLQVTGLVWWCPSWYRRRSAASLRGEPAGKLCNDDDDLVYPTYS